MMSLLLDEVALAALRLADAGVESPRADAELIAASVHNVKRGELHTVPDAAFDARFWADIARRAAREPLQHITGRAHFRYLELDVGPGVFVPRPETEVLVEVAKAIVPTTVKQAEVITAADGLATVTMSAVMSGPAMK